MNIFNQTEFYEICRKLNIEPRFEEVTIHYEADDYFNKVKKAVETDRRGEVVFCVVRPNGKIILVTCEEYPKGIFRIPTGGIAHNEDIIEAVYRETREELGLDVEISEFAGVIKIKFQYGEDSVMFCSYLFILKEIGGKLLEDAIDDEVSEVKEVELEGLKQTAESLKNIEGHWNDWGRFRYVTTNAIYRFMVQKGFNMENMG